MIEIKGVLRVNDDGEVWFQSQDGNQRIIGHDRPEDVVAGIIALHVRNVTFHLKEVAKVPDQRAREVRAERG